MVVFDAPFHFTVELEIKLLPVIVRLKAAPPAAAAFGLKPVIAGKGLLMVKLCALEMPPPGDGLNTVT